MVNDVETSSNYPPDVIGRKKSGCFSLQGIEGFCEIKTAPKPSQSP
ncbi:hypothetical protein [Nostoc sp.]